MWLFYSVFPVMSNHFSELELSIIYNPDVGLRTSLVVIVKCPSTCLRMPAIVGKYVNTFAAASVVGSTYVN